MTKNKDETKAITEHISCDFKFNGTRCNSKQKWNSKTCQCECKNHRKCKKGYSCNPRTCICENSKYLKSVAGTSVTVCDEIVIFMNIISIKRTNTIAIKMTNTIATYTSSPSINCRSKKVRDCYIPHTVLLVTILILIIIIIWYYYVKQKVAK